MDAESTSGHAVDITGIIARIPHRYPFLLIDAVTDIIPGESAIGLKNVTVNENFFQGHFPDHPIMPGVLIIEAMAQTAAIVVIESLGNANSDKLVYFMSIDNARFQATPCAYMLKNNKAAAKSGVLRVKPASTAR